MSEHPGLFLEVSDITHPITLETIFVPKKDQRSGVGTKAMRRLCSHADEIGSRILLKPDDCFGTPKAVLIQWYRTFGFVPRADGTLARSSA